RRGGGKKSEAGESFHEKRGSIQQGTVGDPTLLGRGRVAAELPQKGAKVKGKDLRGLCSFLRPSSGLVNFRRGSIRAVGSWVAAPFPETLPEGPKAGEARLRGGNRSVVSTSARHLP
ncbi:MAG: hypothetical protein KDM91_18435, partial [Verrucomicrobiae bacterium]|nr:hypothetical protein [Verrucomicrobiae bacterium]